MQLTLGKISQNEFLSTTELWLVNFHDNISLKPFLLFRSQPISMLQYSTIRRQIGSRAGMSLERRNSTVTESTITTVKIVNTSSSGSSQLKGIEMEKSSPSHTSSRKSVISINENREAVSDPSTIYFTKDSTAVDTNNITALSSVVKKSNLPPDGKVSGISQGKRTMAVKETVHSVKSQTATKTSVDSKERTKFKKTARQTGYKTSRKNTNHINNILSKQRTSAAECHDEVSGNLLNSRKRKSSGDTNIEKKESMKVEVKNRTNGRKKDCPSSMDKTLSQGMHQAKALSTSSEAVRYNLRYRTVSGASSNNNTDQDEIPGSDESVKKYVVKTKEVFDSIPASPIKVQKQKRSSRRVASSESLCKEETTKSKSKVKTGKVQSTKETKQRIESKESKRDIAKQYNLVESEIKNVQVATSQTVAQKRKHLVPSEDLKDAKKTKLETHSDVKEEDQQKSSYFNKWNIVSQLKGKIGTSPQSESDKSQSYSFVESVVSYFTKNNVDDMESNSSEKVRYNLRNRTISGSPVPSATNYSYNYSETRIRTPSRKRKSKKASLTSPRVKRKRKTTSSSSKDDTESKTSELTDIQDFTEEELIGLAQTSDEEKASPSGLAVTSLRAKAGSPKVIVSTPSQKPRKKRVSFSEIVQTSDTFKTVGPRKTRSAANTRQKQQNKDTTDRQNLTTPTISTDYDGTYFQLFFVSKISIQTFMIKNQQS